MICVSEGKTHTTILEQEKSRVDAGYSRYELLL